VDAGGPGADVQVPVKQSRRSNRVFVLGLSDIVAWMLYTSPSISAKKLHVCLVRPNQEDPGENVKKSSQETWAKSIFLRFVSKSRSHSAYVSPTVIVNGTADTDVAPLVPPNLVAKSAPHPPSTQVMRKE